MKFTQVIGCLSLLMFAVASPAFSSQLADDLSTGKVQDDSAAAFYFNTGLAQTDLNQSTNALANFKKASQHSVNDARYWYHRFAAELSIGDVKSAASSLRVASTVRATNPMKESQTMAGISRIQGDLRQLVIEDFIETRLALMGSATADQLIEDAIGSDASATLDSLMKALKRIIGQGGEVMAELSEDQSIVESMLTGSQPIEGVTEDDLNALRIASIKSGESTEHWANRFAAGLQLSDGKITWDFDACQTKSGNLQTLVLKRIVSEILQKTASQEDYQRLLDNAVFSPNWIDCDRSEDPQRRSVPFDVNAEDCPCTCHDLPLENNAHRCFLKR
jgi:hypothetical protein